MKVRRAVLIASIAALLTGAACAPQATGPEAIDWQRPYCPFDDKVVVYDGDSLVTKWPAWVDLPAGHAPYNTARGGSFYSRDISPELKAIGSRVLADLDECGNGIGAAVISGGAVDLSWGVSASEVITALDALDQKLQARGVPTVFLTITPVSDGTPWVAAHQADRQTINNWMRTPGNLHGTVVDCASVLESAPGSDVLAKKYWNYTDWLGTIDILHPNDAGFEVVADCIQPSILAALDD